MCAAQDAIAVPSRCECPRTRPVPRPRLPWVRVPAPGPERRGDRATLASTGTRTDRLEPAAAGQYPGTPSSRQQATTSGCTYLPSTCSGWSSKCTVGLSITQSVCAAAFQPTAFNWGPWVPMPLLKQPNNRSSSTIRPVGLVTPEGQRKGTPVEFCAHALLHGTRIGSVALCARRTDLEGRA